MNMLTGPCGADFSLPWSTEVDPTKIKSSEVAIVRIDPRYFRPSKAKQHALLKQHGYSVNVSLE